MNRRKKVKRLGAKTISFPKGKGHLTHNNREFISNNVVPERTAWNRIYIQESLEQAYEKCFGQALMEYNAGQKRKDRRKENYLKEIENSGNKEKTFYENIVQIGKRMTLLWWVQMESLLRRQRQLLKYWSSMQKRFKSVIPICICLIVLCTWMKQRHTCTLIIFRLRMAIKQA